MWYFYIYDAGPLYWPTFVVVVLASLIASQAIISGTLSIIQQSLSLGCFPRVIVIHTSTKYEGQVYVPEANYLLMLACVAVTLGFRTTTNIGNAYGIAVVFVMTLTTSFLVLVMIMIWKTHLILLVCFILIIGNVELLYLSSILYKFNQGGCLPLTFAAVLMVVMYTWNNVFRRKLSQRLVLNNNRENVGEIVDDRQVEEDHMQPAEAVEREIEGVDKAWHAGIVHFIGETEVIAGKGASFGKRILIDYAYTILKRNLRDSDEVFDIPHKQMLKVGMTYEHKSII
ncbi:hypothetical protein SO802_033175 [Lithocarpus litseifolius]|uniref:Potassium transporter 5-like n=1 Tax=Lithocarpus litseifolius TaxID=425828 RepID=A0AAW2BFK8_9ROSI